MARRCFWPPERVTPFSPTSVSYPLGKRAMSSWTQAMRATRSISSRLASGLPRAMLAAMVVEKRKGSWGT
ncbi:hypothetical protein D3C72_749890 [compost metagenome]